MHVFFGFVGPSGKRAFIDLVTEANAGLFLMLSMRVYLSFYFFILFYVFFLINCVFFFFLEYPLYDQDHLEHEHLTTKLYKFNKKNPT